MRGPRLVHPPLPTSVTALPKLGPPLFTLSKGRGRRRPRHSVRGPPALPSHQPHPFVVSGARVFRRPGEPALSLSKGTTPPPAPKPDPPLFTLSKGRSRTCPEPAEGLGRLRPNSVRGPPRTQPPPTPPRRVPLPAKFAALSPSPLRERAGVRVAASVNQPGQRRAPSARSRPSSPSPRGED